MSKVYTRTGDRGKTSLYTGERVSKDSLRVEAYGSVDEADSVLGQARAFAVHEDLWMLMADVASVGNEPNIKPEDVTELERLIDSYTESLQPLDHFLVPGETKSESFLNAARSVVRRAERAMWRLNESEPVNEVDIRYLNRLSDLCFTLGRYESEVK